MGRLQIFMEKVEIIKQADTYWGIAYVRYRAEKKLTEKLYASGVVCYLPTVPHAYIMHNTKIITRIPMFPCYLFLRLNREEVTELRYREKQISRIELQFDEHREQLLMNELRALQQCEQMAQDMPVLINPGIVAGDKVLVKEGSLKGLVADVIRRNDENDSIIINVTMLNHHIEFPVSAEMLKKITE